MRNSKSIGLLLGLTFAAFAISVYKLDSQSLRGDEAFDAVFIAQPLSTWLGVLRYSQPYPPLYHLALSAWTAIAGNSVFAMRFLSVASALPVVPLSYQLGRLWFGRPAGQWAALLAAFHPFLIWYAQDRLYAPLIMLALGSTVFAVMLWQGRSGKRIWFGYVTLTLLSLAIHYAALFLVIAHNLVALMWSHRRRDMRWWRTWLSAQGLIALAYLPWIVIAWPVLTSHTSSWAQPATLPDMLARLFRAYSVGLTITTAEAIVPLFGFGLIAALGLLVNNPRPDHFERVAAITLILAPIVCVFIFSLSRPMFDERYVVFIIPPYLAVLGRGLSITRRWAQGAFTATMLAGMIIATLNYRFDPHFAKAPDWNATFAYLQTNARPADAIVYTYPDPALQYYTQDRWSLYLVPPGIPPDMEQIRRLVHTIAATHPRIWLIPQWSSAWDKDRLAEQALDAVTERAAELRAGPFPAVLYHTQDLYETERTSLNAVLGGHIRLIGATVRQPDATPVRSFTAHPSDPIRVTLYWRADRRPETDYSVFVHLIDATGSVHSQQDNWPRGGSYPTSWWTPDEEIVDTYVLSVKPDIPAGPYALIVGMYDATGTRLPVTGTDGDTENARIVLPVAINIQAP